MPDEARGHALLVLESNEDFPLNLGRKLHLGEPSQLPRLVSGSDRGPPAPK
jgi:hypothetical protein